MKRACLSLTLLASSLAGQSPTASPKPGIDAANLDRGVKPCEDFYRFANGAWLKTHPIPADQVLYGGFNEVRDRNREVLKGILEEAAGSKAAKGSTKQKVGDFYRSGMDTAAIDRAGLRPLAAELQLIAGVRDAASLSTILARLRLSGAGVGAFHFSVSQDQKESTRTIGVLSQGGLGLPDRDYYTKTDPRSVELREKYEAHVAEVLGLMGDAPEAAKAGARGVMELETRLAKASLTRVEGRDPQKTYNKRSLAALLEEAPGFEWKAYFGALNLGDPGDLNVRQPDFFKALARCAKEVPAEQWRTYLRWHLARAHAGELPQAFEQASFAFYGTVLTGQKEQEARWKRVQAATDSALGEALGRLYVERAFGGDSKARMLVLVENLRTALKEKIVALPWMSEPTKRAALAKLAAFRVKIGYPDTWRDYSKLEIRPGAYLENVKRARAFEVRRNLAKLGKPVDRGEWGMTPPTVNAYYSPTLNEIVFPAGILQPPFFDPKADDAVNYGAIGMVIGHEMTHGFDDSGSQYDAAGNLRNWWTPEDRKAYEARTDLVVKQFDAFEALPGEHVNGKLTLGENIADLGGLKIAFAAWKKSQEGRPAPAPIEGFTPEQRFFLGLAQIWRNNIRPEALRVRLATDPHSPGEFRVVGPLSNLPEFFEAFGCAEGSRMKREETVRPTIW